MHYKGGYRGRVVADYETHYTPVFSDPELAELAASVLIEKVHGEYAVTRRPEVAA